MNLAILPIGLYLVVILGMITVLEILPSLSQYMPTITPFLIIIGVLNLALISQQENREAAVHVEREERKSKWLQERSAKQPGAVQKIDHEVGQRKPIRVLIVRSRKDSMRKQKDHQSQKLKPVEA